MTAKRTPILICLLLTPMVCRAAATGSKPLTTTEYRAELDRLSLATQQLNSSGAPTPDALHHLPQSWHVSVSEKEFDILTEGLQRDVRRYEEDKSAANAIAIRRRLDGMRSEIDGFEKPPADVSASRAELNSILARREFRDVSGPTWLDRLKRRLLDFILRILSHVIQAASIPTVGKTFVYVLMGIALAALLYIAYRSIFRSQELDEVVPRDLPVSAKEWAIWLAEARAAAARSEWRDAIHLAYWAGISFLERQGFWKPDRARTPREYLRLLSAESGHHETLTSLTKTFELAWYAKRDVGEQAFSETLSELEKLGCR